MSRSDPICFFVPVPWRPAQLLTLLVGTPVLGVCVVFGFLLWLAEGTWPGGLWFSLFLSGAAVGFAADGFATWVRWRQRRLGVSVALFPESEGQAATAVLRQQGNVLHSQPLPRTKPPRLRESQQSTELQQNRKPQQNGLLVGLIPTV